MPIRCNGLAASVSAALLDFVGRPRQGYTYRRLLHIFACAPKSSAYMAVSKALKNIENGRTLECRSIERWPLQSAPSSQGQGYKFPHDIRAGCYSDYLGSKDELRYMTKDIGREKAKSKNHRKLRSIKLPISRKMKINELTYKRAQRRQRAIVKARLVAYR